MLAWAVFLGGIAVGGLVMWLWMRARIAELGASRQTFQAMADAALLSNQNTFLDVARSTLGENVRPLAESLDRLQGQVHELEMARQKIFGSLDTQLNLLAKETVTLANALRTPQVRGRWGEVTLRRVAELAGMVKNCDFLEQDTRQTETGRIRPDMVVRLPGGRELVVDAKVPLTAYIDAMGATDEPARRAALQRHSQQLSEHVRQLSSKQYWAQFQPAPELVVLFLPGDQFFSAALECNPALIEDALARKVIIATPVTLISVLKGIAYGWNQEQLAENAEHIRQIACEFYERMQVFYESYADTGHQIERAVQAYNKSARSWDARLTPSLRKIRELGVPGTEPVPPEIIDVVAARPRAVGQ